MAATNQPMIQLKDVNRICDGGAAGLKDINLNIDKGESVVVIDLSDADKSTLLRSINRLQNVFKEDILIDGKSITSTKGKGLREVRRDIDMIFQSFNLVKRSNALRNVLTGRVTYYPTWETTFSLFTKEDKQEACEALQRVGLADKVYARADQLSGGQQQRIAITRILIRNPKIILADGPTASPGPQTSRRIMHGLRTFNEEYGMTVVANLHSVELAKEFGDRVVGARADQIVYDGRMSETSQAVFDDIYNGGNGKEGEEDT